MRLGLTGGIGSGKSTVAQFLQAEGAAIIDADQIARAVTAPGGSAIAAISAEFGADFIDARQALDRDKMRQLAFQDPTARKRLEQIIHPLVDAVATQQTQMALAAGKTLIVHDIPLLVESARWRAQLDRILVIDCTELIQIERVTQRSGLSAAAVQAIMAAQAPRALRLAAADDVICNEGISLTQLQAEVHQWVACLRL